MRSAKDYLAPNEAAALLTHSLPLLQLADDARCGDIAPAHAASELQAILSTWLAQRTAHFEEHVAKLEASVDKYAAAQQAYFAKPFHDNFLRSRFIS